MNIIQSIMQLGSDCANYMMTQSFWNNRLLRIALALIFICTITGIIFLIDNMFNEWIGKNET